MTSGTKGAGAPMSPSRPRSATGPPRTNASQSRSTPYAIPGDVENVTEYYVFRLKDLGNDDFEMEDIDDEEEYDAAADAYEEKLDARAWSRMMEQK